jgi:hypothetical protein
MIVIINKAYIPFGLLCPIKTCISSYIQIPTRTNKSDLSGHVFIGRGGGEELEINALLSLLLFNLGAVPFQK